MNLNLNYLLIFIIKLLVNLCNLILIVLIFSLTKQNKS